MLSHADMHLMPEDELARGYREHIAKIVGVQGQASWDEDLALRSLRCEGVLFVPRSASGLPPGTTRSVALLGLGLMLLGVAALGPFEGWVAVVMGGLGLAALGWGGLGLAQWNQRREAQAAGPTREGLYLFDDAAVLLGPPVPVVHRPERCGAQLIPKGAVRGVSVVSGRGPDGAPSFVVELEVRKTTGELVRHALDAWPSSSRRHPLKAQIDAWLAT